MDKEKKETKKNTDRGTTREFLRGDDTNFGLIYRVKFLFAADKVSCKLFSKLCSVEPRQGGGGTRGATGRGRNRLQR